MISSAEFKASVAAHIERQASDQLPVPHELLLIGHGVQGWKRTRIKPPYSWLAHWMVRGFLLKWEIDRMAIVIPGETRREFRVGFVARVEESDPSEITDKRLGNLVATARREWSEQPEPLRLVFGRPWPITLLVIALCLDLLLGVQRIALTLTGRYLWLPVIPDLVSALLHVGYLVLLVATIHQLWRQTRAGYVLALALAAAQLARLLLLAIPEAQLVTEGAFIWWLSLEMLFPALIGVSLLLVYQTRRSVT